MEIKNTIKLTDINIAEALYYIYILIDNNEQIYQDTLLKISDLLKQPKSEEVDNNINHFKELNEKIENQNKLYKMIYKRTMTKYIQMNNINYLKDHLIDICFMRLPIAYGYCKNDMKRFALVYKYIEKYSMQDISKVIMNYLLDRTNRDETEYLIDNAVIMYYALKK